MFTGIIWSTGTLQKKIVQAADQRLIIAVDHLPTLELGESIAVNGVCLSVEEQYQESFVVYASHETLERTTLKTLPIGTVLNLERALRLEDRLGGHLVSGHIDCLATIVAVSRVGASLTIQINYPPNYTPQIIAKGSVALDGISLTVNAVSSGRCTVNIIPDTQKRTNVHTWKVGKQLNLETDLIGKYVQSLLARTTQPALDRDFLKTCGFF
ncbi:MAG: riboflavin synthase [Desulfovibrio sp.]|nr:riboflavin synthase [Desulfovibrio sp.]